MSDTPKKQWDGSSAHTTYVAHPHPPGTPLKPTPPKKRARRKGQLNDGQWAEGYGPDAKKPKPK